MNVACDSDYDGLGGEINNEVENDDDGDVDIEIEWAEALDVNE